MEPLEAPTGPIQKAVNMAQAGDNILVSPGTYGERVLIHGRNMGSGANRVLITKNPGQSGTVTLNPGSWEWPAVVRNGHGVECLGGPGRRCVLGGLRILTGATPVMRCSRAPRLPTLGSSCSSNSSRAVALGHPWACKDPSFAELSGSRDARRARWARTRKVPARTARTRPCGASA